MTQIKCFSVVTPNYIDPAIVAIGTFLTHNHMPFIVYAENGANCSRLRRALSRFSDVEIRPVDFPEWPVFDDVHNRYSDMFFRREAMPAYAQRIAALREMSHEADIIVNIDADTMTLNTVTPAIERVAEGRIGGVSERENRTRWQSSLGIEELADMPLYFNTGFGVYSAQAIPDDILSKYAAFLRTFHDRIFCPEQDFLNYELADLITPLPHQYNLMFTDRRYTAAAPAVVHFVGIEKPWSPRLTFCNMRMYHYFRLYDVKARSFMDTLDPDFCTRVAKNAAAS